MRVEQTGKSTLQDAVRACVSRRGERSAAKKEADVWLFFVSWCFGESGEEGGWNGRGAEGAYLE